MDIYNMNNRWDKDPALYEAFGESDSSFGRLSYRDAKERKNVLQSLFSKKAAVQAHRLVESKFLEKQVRSLVADRRELQKLPHTSTIYHLLLGPEVANPPSQLSILEETQTQVFAGESSGLTLMHGSFHIIQTPRVYRKLREELMAAWPDLEQPPSLATLEQLPYLNATVKESLRMGGGATSPLLRVVPQTGAKIDGKFVPPGTGLQDSVGSPAKLEWKDRFVPVYSSPHLTVRLQKVSQ
ncbi:hypothetical protein ATERTT37_006315 [Aspergillus terreus]